jgi:hypothetical protein
MSPSALVKHWVATLPGGKMGIQEQKNRPEPRKQAENRT